MTNKWHRTVYRGYDWKFLELTSKIKCSPEAPLVQVLKSI
jgi:hypothetical protein